jgi:hypothetical protein
MTGFRFNEKYLSQIPAYLPPDQALKGCWGKPDPVLR